VRVDFAASPSLLQLSDVDRDLLADEAVGTSSSDIRDQNINNPG
jgi:hypothetical protein